MDSSGILCPSEENGTVSITRNSSIRVMGILRFRALVRAASACSVAESRGPDRVHPFAGVDAFGHRGEPRMSMGLDLFPRRHQDHARELDEGVARGGMGLGGEYSRVHLIGRLTRAVDLSRRRFRGLWFL